METPNWRDDYVYHCGCRLHPRFGYTAICKVDAKRINRWYQENAEEVRGVLPAIVRRILTTETLLMLPRETLKEINKANNYVDRGISNIDAYIETVAALVGATA